MVCASEVIVEAQCSERKQALQLAEATADQTAMLRGAAPVARPRVQCALGRTPASRRCETATGIADFDDGALEACSSAPGYGGSPRVSLGACGSAAEAVDEGVGGVTGAASGASARQAREEPRSWRLGLVLSIRGMVDIEELTVAEHQEIVEELMETCGSGGKVRAVLFLTGPMADALGGGLLAGDALLRCADGAAAQQVLSQYGRRKFDGRAVQFTVVDPAMEASLITIIDEVAASGPMNAVDPAWGNLLFTAAMENVAFPAVSAVP